MQKITKSELERILELHQQWLENNTKGEQANLSELNFSEMDLSGLDFSECILNHSVFDYCIMDQTKFNQAILSHASMRNVRGEKSSFIGATMDSINMNNSKLKNAVFTDAELYLAVLVNVDFPDVYMPDAKINYADMSLSKFINGYFNSASMEMINLDGTVLDEADFRSVKMNHSSLRQASLKKSSFCMADLASSDFIEADCSETDFKFSNLAKTNFDKTIMKEADTRYISSTDGIRGTDVIEIQINTTRKSNKICYWSEHNIVTTGCFQGTLNELKKRVEYEHKYNEFLLKRYRRVISYFKAETKRENEYNQQSNY